MNWQEVENELDILAQQIGYRPDVIVAIARGGLVPGRLLAKSLDVKTMFSLTVIKSGSERKVASAIDPMFIAGKNILLVEDMIESGRSLLVSKQYLESLGASVKTAALYTTPSSETGLDYLLTVRPDIPVFPWD